MSLNAPRSSLSQPKALHQRRLARRICNFLYLCLMRAELPPFLAVRKKLVDVMLGRNHENLAVHTDVVLADYRHLTLGKSVVINRGCHLSCSGGLTIGDYVAIGHGTSIMTTEHDYRDPDVPIAWQPAIFAPVEIGSNVWIGAQVCILAGVSIASGTVIAAGSVVTKSFLEPDTIIGGVPARILKHRFEQP